MNSESCNDDADRESRLNELLIDYVEELQQGRAPDRRQFLARYPEFASELKDFLTLREQLDTLIAPVRDGALSGSSGRGNLPPPPASTETGAPDTVLGRIGEFQLLREIGRGGMGVVYEAFQTSLNRRVALKVLPFAAAFDPRLLQRFQNEAQAAGQLHHANIVPVYGVGQERGVHYYAMQLIDGQSLAQLIADLRLQIADLKNTLAPSGSPAIGNPQSAISNPTLIADLRLQIADLKNTLAPSGSPAIGNPQSAISNPTLVALSTEHSRRRVNFFRRMTQLIQAAAEALEHAHQAGVVHRDIKPANLLLDVRGNLWITDFGLALFHNTSALTVTGELVGTLRYMSPEQAAGQRAVIDHRTDIYSLGATLYELLTLRPIFDGTERQALMNQILHQEPRPPRSIDRSIPPELETIVLKAIGKTPAERYATAGELADDLQRFLEDRPIHARRPSPLEKATKWARRHKPVVVSAVVVMLLALTGMLVATVLIARAYDRELQKSHEADVQGARAEASFRQARQVVDQLAQLGEEELADRPDLEALRWRLLERVLSYYQDFIRQCPDDPWTQADLEASRKKATAILEELTVLMRSLQYIPLHWVEVQDELRLSAAKREAIAQMQRNWTKGLAEAYGRPAGERERRRLEMARKQEAEIATLLSAREHRRFKEIALQFLGALAFSDPDVAQTLQLTSEQKRQFRAIQDYAGGPGLFGWPGRQGPAPGNGGQNSQETMFNLLTASQRAKWAELTGTPSQGLAAHAATQNRK